MNTNLFYANNITDRQVNEYTKKWIKKPSKELGGYDKYKLLDNNKKALKTESKKESSEYKKNTDKIENWDFLDKL